VALSILTPVHANLGSKWCLSGGKRLMDIVAATLGLFLLFPVIFVIALAIAINSGKPVLFRQQRVGRNSRNFHLLKFRTMKIETAKNGVGLTCDGDSRVTGIGRWLRKRKLDEFPQLFNVLKGEMTLVGPRPDLEEFWSRASAEDRRVLELKPGITGAASLAFCDEERLLAQVSPEQLTSFYLQQVLPQKARIDREYAVRATFQSDCAILLKTVFVPLFQMHRIGSGVIERKANEQVSK
jgi:lipopolysaccharide/colanic/teichoic acid biosynthesis glycosyltransferase